MDDVQQARPAHQLRHRRDLFQGLRRLDKHHVGAGLDRVVGAPDRLVEPGDGARVGARDDHEVAAAARGSGGADLGQPVVARHDLLVVEMAAFLRKALVLDMDAGDPGGLVLAHRAHDVQLVAVAGIGVGDDRQVDRGGDAAGVVHHLGHRDEAEIGIAQGRGGAGAGHVDRVVTRRARSAAR